VFLSGVIGVAEGAWVVVAREVRYGRRGAS
jgi:hypothetical protein